MWITLPACLARHLLLLVNNVLSSDLRGAALNQASNSYQSKIMVPHGDA